MRTQTKDNQEKDKEYYLKVNEDCKDNGFITVNDDAAEKVMGEHDSYTERTETEESWRKLDVGKQTYKHPALGNARESLAKWWGECEPEIQQRLKLCLFSFTSITEKGLKGLQFSIQINNSKKFWPDLQCLRQSAAPKAFLFYVGNLKRTWSLLLYVFLSEQRRDVFRSIKLASHVLLALRKGQIQVGITLDLPHWWRWAENNETACLY